MDLEPVVKMKSEFAPIGQAFRFALKSARLFDGATAPNPPVGCVLLDHAKDILSIGAHQAAGQPHAERMALAELPAGTKAQIAVVTLEPCAHFGRTPPCVDGLIEAGVKAVWIGAKDLNPRVAGGGAARLRDAGIEVHFLADMNDAAAKALHLDCQRLIAPFLHFAKFQRPFVTLKVAIDASGSMIPPVGEKTFTRASSLKFAHKLRRRADAIVTGSGTILADNPHFTVRHVDDVPAKCVRSLFWIVVGACRLNICGKRKRAVLRQPLPGICKRHSPTWVSAVVWKCWWKRAQNWLLPAARSSLLILILPLSVWPTQIASAQSMRTHRSIAYTPKEKPMFSGIIDRLGAVQSVREDDGARVFEIDTRYNDLALGESVAINGVCLTVVTFDEAGKAEFYVSPESLSRTALGTIQTGDRVNLERAVALETKLSGHLVQGHVDGIATLSSIEEQAGAHLIELELPKLWAAIVLKRGRFHWMGSASPSTILKITQRAAALG